MTLAEIAKELELLDEKENLYCYEDAGNIIASFSTWVDIIEVFSPQELSQIEAGKFTQEDLIRKFVALMAQH